MTLLIVILLTANGMAPPQVYRLSSDAACVAMLPKAEAVALQYSTHGYIAACVSVSGAPNA